MVSKIAVTTGDPAGIGPDLALCLAAHDWNHQLVLCGSRSLLAQRAKQLNITVEFERYDPVQPAKPSRAGVVTVADFTLGAEVVAGQLDERNGQYVLDTLAFASEGNMSGEFAAVVTGPVHKGIINQAGVSFSGHTEFFAQQANTPDVVMLLANDQLKVALVTTHIPLAYVAKAITADRLEKITTILYDEMKRKFGLSKPKIYVCGLNPHAGEDGHLGREEIEVITPTLDKLREQGMDLIGPLPADTLFQKKYLKDADVVLAMYHDQGLPVLKSVGFGRSVNITLGLPFIRTSVDHGTALELAGTGQADSGSLMAAVNQAIEMVEKRV